MKRKAILLAASPGNNPTPGVISDLSAFHSFLRSSPGGLWEPEEIICNDSPTRDSILKYISEAQDAEYSLIYFAGHGEVTKSRLPWPETSMHLNSGQTITEQELNSGTPRCTLIMDCSCRMPETDGDKLLIKTSMLLEHGKSGAEYRNLYMNSVAAAESGLVKIFVTRVDSSAAGAHSFTRHLLNETNIWISKNRGILYLREAVELARYSMKLENPQQQPEYEGGRRMRHFPFAVQI